MCMESGCLRNHKWRIFKKTFSFTFYCILNAGILIQLNDSWVWKWCVGGWLNKLGVLGHVHWVFYVGWCMCKNVIHAISVLMAATLTRFLLSGAQNVHCYGVFDTTTGACGDLLGDEVSQADCCLNQKYGFQLNKDAPCQACRWVRHLLPKYFTTFFTQQPF